ncbi:MAG: M1 family metallopeptidase [Cyclobacteriaceae bacterium]|nr:M1 family metallopeptidase [Cyclobacteriaceae bacterium]
MIQLMKISTGFLFLMLVTSAYAQDYRWQQRVEYSMNVQLNTQNHKLTGDQKLVYHNNSPDTLTKVYYHLFFNAFQPGSMMDVRSRTIADPDRRVMDRISKLGPDEIGYQHIQSLKQDGKAVTYKVNGTILEVTLAKPMLPKTKTTFDMTFEAQVPVQIRRSGRDNREGISYSMTQWYPKLAEYDYQGWHAYQYVAREFHGVWGDFDVKITLDPKFVIGGTGKLQNPEAVGHGYEKPGTAVKRPKGDLTWHFVAKDVIDFAWAADPDYTHDKIQVPNGPELHFFYQKNEKTATTWKNMQPVAVKVFQFLNETFGKYPFDTYSVIQGGDGGMEYPMCTLILGEGSQAGVIGTMTHEVAHSWYQMTLASNEALYAWMDEGFTSFASGEASASINNKTTNHEGSYAGYFSLVSSGLQEPAIQHSDHFTTNRAYSTAAYSMGAVFLQQLKYLVGDDHFYKGMKLYYNTWKMRHPEPNDFVRIMEKVSGQQLHWYYRYWIQTTKRIDYGVGSVTEADGNTIIELQRIGEFPMPVDLLVTYTDGRKELFYIPLNEQLGSKPVEDKNTRRSMLPDWPWVYPTYNVQVNRKSGEIQSIEIDPSQRMADINRKDNLKVLTEAKAYKDPTQ